MFGGNAAGQKPPCQAGREAGANYLMCEPCQVGLYAEAESHCQECPPGRDIYIYILYALKVKEPGLIRQNVC